MQYRFERELFPKHSPSEPERTLHYVSTDTAKKESDLLETT